MGDGGIACVASQHVVERFPEAFCAGGGSNGNGFGSKSMQFADSNSSSSSSSSQQQRKNEKNMEVEREEFSSERGQNGEFKKSSRGEAEKLQIEELGKEKSRLEKRRKGDSASERGQKGKGAKLRKGEVKKEVNVLESSQKWEVGEIIPERWQMAGELEREEFCLEKGRKGEFNKGSVGSEKWSKGEVEKEEIISGKWRRGEVENGEIVSDDYQRGEIEKGEIVPEKWRKGELEKGEFVPDKCRKGELEKHGISCERRQKGEVSKEEFGSGRGRRWELERGEFTLEKGRNRDRETPGKFADDDFSQRNDCSRSGSEQRKRSSRWEAACERETKSSSRVTDDESGLYKSDYGDEKNRSKDHSSGTWLKRHNESESSSRRCPGDFSDYSAVKSRRISDDSNHSGYSDKLHLRSSVESSYRNSCLASRVSSSSRYASRHYDSSSSSRVHDRHGRSPSYSERSPHNRSRHYDHRDRSPARLISRHGRSPGYSDRSPPNRSRHYDCRDRSPAAYQGYSEHSPHARSRRHDHKDRSPVHSERSPRDRARHHEHRDRTPLHLDRSPRDRGRPNDSRETNRKPGGNEKNNSRYGSQGREERLGQKDSGGRDSHRHSINKPSNNITSLGNSGNCLDKSVNGQSYNDKELQNQDAACSELPTQVIEAPEELLSMEEDMDICDTPPHVPAVADSKMGKWFYLDHFGVEQGPSKLCDLKGLVEEGVLQSDHLIKHSESDRWVTVENAASPLASVNLQSIVSDTVTQLVNPPEAPGNLLMDSGDAGHPANHGCQELSIGNLQPLVHLGESTVMPESLEDLLVDERVGALMKGHTIIPGKELETLGEALQMMFEHADLEKWGVSEGFSRSRPRFGESSGHLRDEEFGRGTESLPKEAFETRLAVSSEEYPFLSSDASDWSSSLWSCKGGDWKRNDEAAQDRSFKRKIVLNEGFPLCQMPKSGYEDPRWHRKDDLYYPFRSRRLDLPPWAFTVTEEKNDNLGESNRSILTSRSSQPKPPLTRVKGTMLPVIRINACVVKDHGSLVSDSRTKLRSNERHTPRPLRSFSASADSKNCFTDGVAQSKAYERDLQLQALLKFTGVNAPKDRVCTVDELQLHLGEWYFHDGTGHERGPSSFSELQALAAQGIIQKHTSVFRKFDKVWVPVTIAEIGSEAVCSQEGNVAAATGSSVASSVSQPQVDHSLVKPSSSFHNLHPQFIGYMRGKLHELVMKSYRSREFAAAINEVLDPWMSSKQPKKETDKHFPFNSAITKSSSGLAHDLLVQKFWKSEDDLSGVYKDHNHAGKRPWLSAGESQDEEDMEEDFLTSQNDISFEDLCGETSVGQENITTKIETASWGLLNSHTLARVFHYLRMDLRSLAISAATCKCWNTAVRFYRDISRRVDLSSIGPNCSDSMFQNIMSGYDKTKITFIGLMGCVNVSAGALEKVLRSIPSISSVDIRGCSQLGELRYEFKNVKWIKSQGSRNSRFYEESHSKMRSLKQITEKSYSNSKAFRGLESHLDDSSEETDSYDYYSSLERKDSTTHTFRQGCYKRTKLLNGRKSSSLLSRDAQMRGWLRRKPENRYKMMEEFITLRLKDIMKENTFQFFFPKVAEIEDRMRNGYYICHGLSSVKEDISRMCWDAIKAKSRSVSGDMNHIIMSFIQLAAKLEENPTKSRRERDEMIKMLNEISVTGSTPSRCRKKHSKTMSEKRGMPKSNGISSANAWLDYGEGDTSDRETRRRLSKLNKKPLDSESETSDDPDFFDEDDRGDGENSDSETETDPEIHSEARSGDLSDGLPFSMDEGLDLEDREWGARMTKQSLVPVTRKYEVIDRYVIVADEEEVQRKMRVALPDDYAEKLSAQKNGTEESEMEIPEVKDYKPRKKLGDEVIEQEVYGIDPYTHNLLLDSMLEESEWPLQEKHLFIEEVLLRTLNKQVRHFTGTGNTPIVYNLQPVVEEILKTAEEGGDARVVKMCEGILMAMQSRREDKDSYVAYRKGLGVVCDKEEGFGDDDFVVEFLGEVYPAWKWFEKQDGIRSLQKNNKDPAPEFYNIYLERPKGDRDGYDLVVVDAMHKANYASRICHSCRPNCEAKVTAVDGQYQIGIYSLRPIRYGEEITFDYNSVTESKDEYEASVCLCGSQVCRGSYLNLTGEGAFQKVLKECHGMLDRHQLMLEACELNFVSEEDYIDLGRAGLGTCLLAGLPDWLIAYSARLVRFINFERTKLPDEILRHNLEEKRKFFLDISLDVEKNDAEIQAEGVYNQRLQNLALTLDKVRYVMRCVFGDPKKAPPPLEKLSPVDVVSLLWKGEGSLVEELLQCITPHMEADLLSDLKSKMHAHDPSGSDDLRRELQKSLLWLRDEVRSLPCTNKCRHDAVADLIHMYAYTKCFFRVRGYKSVTSPPVYISPLDLGPKYADKLGSGLQEYCKTYRENYCLGQLIYWHNQANAEPDCSLSRARRGCVLLPDVSSFYAKSPKLSWKRAYGLETLRYMLSRMEKHPQRPWGQDQIWTFKSAPQILGSPMLDAVMNKSALDREMLHWLKNRTPIFQGTWDR